MLLSTIISLIISCTPNTSLVKTDLAQLISVTSAAPDGLLTDPIIADLSHILADPVRPYVYVTDKAQNKLHIYNTDTYEQENSIFVGSMPMNMEIKEDGSQLFVFLAGGSHIAVVDLTTHSLLEPINHYGGMVVGANNIMYVSVGDQVTLLDISTLPPKTIGSIPAKSIPTTTGLTTRIQVIGRSTNLNVLYTYENNEVTQWDISGTTPTLLQTVASNIVFSTPNVPRISTSADDAIVFSVSPWYSTSSFPNLTIHKSADLTKLATLNVQWYITAAAINPTGNRIAIAHDDTLSSSLPLELIHDKRRQDLHIFDAVTYTEIGHYLTEGYVKNNGITYGPDGKIYLLLGEAREIGGGEWPGRIVSASNIGVIVPND